MNTFDIENNDTKIMKVTTKYVITNTERLVSPAGYHPSTHVFEQTKIAIHCDAVPEKLPNYNGNLYLHEISKVCKS